MTGKLTIACTDWRPLEKNTLVGFARIRIAELDLIIYDIAIHESHGRRWAALPARPWIKDGAVVTDDAGKPQYSPLFEFGRKEVRDAFSERVIAAVLAFAPGAFGVSEGAA